MKLPIAILVACISVAWAGDVPLRVVRHNKEVAVSDAGSFTTNVLALLRSCSVNHNPIIGWNEIVRSDSFIHIRFTNPPVVKVWWGGSSERHERPIDEIRIWLPEGRWPAIQARSGEQMRSCGKYDPLALKRVVSDPALGLSSVRPYDSIIKLNETRR